MGPLVRPVSDNVDDDDLLCTECDESCYAMTTLRTLHSKHRLVETTNTLVDMCLTKLLVKNNQS